MCPAESHRLFGDFEWWYDIRWTSVAAVRVVRVRGTNTGFVDRGKKALEWFDVGVIASRHIFRIKLQGRES